MDAALRRSLVLCLVWLAAAPAWGIQQLVGLNNIDLGLWSPSSGNARNSDDFCVAARLGNSQNVGRYAARVAPLSGSVYRLVGITNPAAAIPISFTFQDLTDSVTSPLQPGVFTTREQAGVRTCTGTNNARVIASALAADILAAPPGEYLAQFRFTGQGIPSKTELSADFSVRLRFADLIRISGLDSIDLGTFDGVGDRQGADDFCVYSNGLTGRYTVTGTGQGTGGAFQVSSGANKLPVRVEYNDGGGLATMTPGTPAQKSNAVRTSVDCVGGNNASIRVTVRATDMRVAPSGAYVGVITLLVAPI